MTRTILVFLLAFLFAAESFAVSESRSEWGTPSGLRLSPFAGIESMSNGSGSRPAFGATLEHSIGTQWRAGVYAITAGSSHTQRLPALAGPQHVEFMGASSGRSRSLLYGASFVYQATGSRLSFGTLFGAGTEYHTYSGVLNSTSRWRLGLSSGVLVGLDLFRFSGVSASIRGDVMAMSGDAVTHLGLAFGF